MAEEGGGNGGGGGEGGGSEGGGGGGGLTALQVQNIVETLLTAKLQPIITRLTKAEGGLTDLGVGFSRLEAGQGEVSRKAEEAQTTGRAADQTASAVRDKLASEVAKGDGPKGSVTDDAAVKAFVSADGAPVAPSAVTTQQQRDGGGNSAIEAILGALGLGGGQQAAQPQDQLGDLAKYVTDNDRFAQYLKQGDDERKRQLERKLLAAKIGAQGYDPYAEWSKAQIAGDAYERKLAADTAAAEERRKNAGFGLKNSSTGGGAVTRYVGGGGGGNRLTNYS